MPGIQILRKVGTDEYVEQTASATGEASVSLSDAQTGDYFANISLQRIPTATTFNIDGTNPTVASGATETIWDSGGNWVPPTTATVVSIVSTSINDIATTGTGARKVILQGLDAARLSITEVVELNGQGTATSVQSFLRLNTVNITETGSSEMNLGAITFTIDGQTAARMRALAGFVQEGVFSLATNESIVVNTAHLAVGKNDEATMYVRVRFSLDGGTNFNQAQFGPFISAYQGDSGIGYPLSRKFFAPHLDIVIEAHNPGAGSVGVIAFVGAVVYDES